MPRQIVFTPNAAKPLATYSQAVKAAGLVFVSGTGPSDPATGQIVEAYTRWVVYTPYATPESTGLSATPVPGGPWLMFPGKPTAHIMINPPRPK